MTTTSRVVYGSKSAELLREQCLICAANGGSYSIQDIYVTGQCWMTEFVLNWPAGAKP